MKEKMMYTKRYRYSPFAAALLVIGCVSSELTIPTNHPGNPGARVGRLASTTALEANFDPSAGAQDSSSAGSPSAGRYTCPMHPEIESDNPGECPKCGMKLAPKQEKK